MHHGLAHRLEIGLELRRHRGQDSFERSKLVGEEPGCLRVLRVLLLELALQIIHESRLRVGCLGSVDIEEQHTIVFDKNLEMEQVQEDRRGSDENVRKIGRVNLSQVPG